MNEQNCENCKHTNKSPGQYPCSVCQSNYTCFWKPADTNDGANNGYDYSTETHDPVNYPSHYTQGAIETIEIIQAITQTMNGFRAYCVGNVLKYIARHEYKGGIEDLKKAAWYLNRLIEEDEAND